MEESREEIKLILNKFQSGYDKRDVNLIDEFMDELITKDNAFVIGTSDGEWCFGYDEVKELFVSDWEYWGDVKLDIPNASITIQDKVAWVSVKGTVSYEFTEDEATYKRFLETVNEFINDEKISNEEKLTKSNYILASLFGNWSEEKRNYRWPLLFSGILIKVDNQWRFSSMLFSMDSPKFFPDERFTEESEYFESVKKLKKKIIPSPLNLEMIEAIENLQIHDTHLITLGNNCWDDNKVLPNMTIDKDTLMVNPINDVALIAGTGYIKQTMIKDEVYQRQMKEILEITSEKQDYKMKAFNVIRDINLMLKELAKGEVFIWPIRLYGVLMKENNQWMIHTLHISYPYDWILEGKYEN